MLQCVIEENRFLLPKTECAVSVVGPWAAVNTREVLRPCRICSRKIARATLIGWIQN